MSIEQGCELLGAAVGEVLKPAKVVLPVDEVAESRATCSWRGSARRRRFCDDCADGRMGSEGVAAERYGASSGGVGAGWLSCSGECGFDGRSSSAEAVVQASGGTAVAVPCSLAELIALMRRASLVIAGDTGPLHLAAALEIPVVGLFGPTDPARNGPYGTPSRVLRHASSERTIAAIPRPKQG